MDLLTSVLIAAGLIVFGAMAALGIVMTLVEFFFMLIKAINGEDEFEGWNR